MHYSRLAILAVSIGVGVCAYAKTPTETHPRVNIATGKELFHQNCSICHGKDAKGYNSKDSGLMYDPDSGEESRRVPPADLTVLSEQNAGKFPADRIRDAVSIKTSIAAHGTPDMPAWGHAFDSLKSNPKRLEESVRNLIAYIESVQNPTKK